MTCRVPADPHTKHGRDARVTLALLAGVLMVLLISGCGSKISQANYYRVQYGMTEEEVEDLLGPAHQTTGGTARASTGPVVVNKSWTRYGLTIHVTFENGVVVGRSAEGIPAETPTTQRATTQKVSITPT